MSNIWLQQVDGFIIFNCGCGYAANFIPLENVVDAVEIVAVISQNPLYSTQECLDEMTRVSFSLTKVLGSNSALDMHQR